MASGSVDLDEANRGRNFVVADIHEATLTRLPPAPETEAAHPALELDAVVVAAGRQLQGNAADIDVAGLRWRLVVADILGGSVTQSSLAAIAPAAYRAALEQGTVMAPTRAQPLHAAADLDMAHRRGRLVAADVVAVSVAENTMARVAPAAHVAAIVQG